FRLGAILGDDVRHRLTYIVNFFLCQRGRSRTLQRGSHLFELTSWVDLEAFRQRGYAVFDLPPGPQSNDPVETKSLLDIDSADAGMRVHAPQERGMKHVRQANIADVHAVSSNEATRFIWLDAAADESG